MSSAVSSQALEHAIIQSVEHGVLPDSEQVSSAELTPSVLPALLANLQQARDEVKADIRKLSQDVAPDVDTWIIQAKQLQVDIERSKATAREIVQEAETGKRLRDAAADCANKAGLLEKEVAFNTSLVETLGQIRAINVALNDCQDALLRNDLLSSLDLVKRTDADISNLAVVQNTRAYHILKTRLQDLRDGLAQRTTEEARKLLDVHVSEHRIIIAGKQSDEPLGLETATDALSYLDALPAYLRRLYRDLDTAILEPLLSTTSDGLTSLRIENDTLELSKGSRAPDALTTLDNISSFLEHLHARLPSTLCSSLSEVLLPPLVENLTSRWLALRVPLSIAEMPLFQKVLDRVSTLAEQIESWGWPASVDALKDWVQSAPRIWLGKRRETALGSVRGLLFTGLKERKIVERIETQMVSSGDALMGGVDDQEDDAWDEAWTEEETSGDKEHRTAEQSKPKDDDGNEEEDDASAWELDDNEQQDEPSAVAPAPSSDKAPDGEEDADAWGWGDDDVNAPNESKTEAETSERSAGPTTKTITLKETYTVTAVPDGILDIVMQVVSDAETLSDATYAGSPIAPAASALYTLPTLLLAMYRATAWTAYGKLSAGNMLIYNDSTRLADQLRSLVARQAEKDVSSQLAAHVRPSSRLKLDKDLSALDTFAKRAYSAEMEAQRTIIRDMLDGAQGFANSTVEPFASACESAVEITTGRIGDVYREWETILSRSALLQSLGSLLSTATSKMIVDIEDLSDIGDEESKKLRHLCDKVSGLRELFMQEQAGGGATGDMTGIYCPNWFKFQYLAEILDSSLADIKYLWTEGELRLEFDADEILDLIQALFADSDYRRKAMAEIRRASRG